MWGWGTKREYRKGGLCGVNLKDLELWASGASLPVLRSQKGLNLLHILLSAGFSLPQRGQGTPDLTAACRDHKHRGLVAVLMCPLGSPVVGTGGRELGVWYAVSAAFSRRLCPPLPTAPGRSRRKGQEHPFQLCHR